MKVLFYNHTSEVSGAERMLLLILARLDRAVFEPVLICPRGPLEKLARELRIKVETTSVLDARFTWRVDRLFHYAQSFLQTIRLIRHQIKEVDPDLIHANSIRSGLVATAATVGMKMRVVWHLHDILPRHPLSTSIRVFAGFSSRTRMIAVSNAVADNFSGRFRWLLKNRVKVILNAIDLEKFEAGAPTRRAARLRLGLKSETLAFGIVGQLTPRKGQLEVIRAFARANLPESVLLVVGAAIFNRDHDYALKIQAEAKALGVSGRVLMLGNRDDVSTVMQSLDLLVVNSTAEPFGLVIVEAMACGTPVLAAAVDGIPEIVQHAKTGWLTPPKNEGALAHAMFELGNDRILLERMGAVGPGYARQNFSADRYLNNLESFYLGSIELDHRALTVESQTDPAEAARFA
jgi:L-malate glycosyltransferase